MTSARWRSIFKYGTISVKRVYPIGNFRGKIEDQRKLGGVLLGLDDVATYRNEYVFSNQGNRPTLLI